MTIDVNVSIDSQSPEGNLVESMMNRDHITPEEAILRALRTLATSAQSRKAQKVAPLTAEEVDRLNTLFPALTALKDVPDETWQKIAKGRMRSERQLLQSPW